MNTIRTLTTATIGALIAFAPNLAHADAPTPTATCDSITITGAAEGTTLLGIDAGYPMEIPAGTTIIYPMPQYTKTHHWTVSVIADGPWTGDPQFTSGDVADCSVPQTDTPALPAHVGGPSPVLNLEVWTDVALAPPW